MDKTQLSLKQFEDLASQGHQTIPVYKRILADLLTPVAAWMHLSENNDYAFLLESVEKGSQYARYSYFGINPKMILSNKDGKTIKIDGSFLDVLRNIQSKYNSINISGIPSFTGGLVGYLGYKTISWIEDIPTHNKLSLNVPDSIFMLFEDIIAFDHLKGIR